MASIAGLVGFGVPADPNQEQTAPVPTAQAPFLCLTETEGLGQPIVDNQAKRGTPVYPEVGGQVDRTQPPRGWSERCQAPARAFYRYVDTGGALRTLPAGATQLPADIAHLRVEDLIGAADMDLGGATQIPHLIHHEVGTLPENRFLYSIAMLTSWEEYLARDTTVPGDHWNQRLVYKFGGGVAIGHSQGQIDLAAALRSDALRRGYAMVYSSGTRTYTHYNLALGGRTALEAKQTFIDRYGTPRYTIGNGGSGGGIQQYVYAQNHPGLLDGAMPRGAYPDMTTQTIHTGDCEPLAHYMDRIDTANPRWANWDNRKLLQGMNTSQGPPRQTTCIAGWRNWSMLNPTTGFPWGLGDVITPFLPEIIAKRIAGAPAYPDDFPDLGRLLRTHEDPAERVPWGHWNDTREVYGTNPISGLANISWDNVGVQYGLRAVANGQITPGEFLDLNARVGSWKDPQDNVPESCAQIRSALDDGAHDLAQLVGMCTSGPIDPYSARNLHFSQDPAVPAPRRVADVAAIHGAFDKGLAFSGATPKLIPIIDFRPYRDHHHNMHIADQSFVARQRIVREVGNADHQSIWFLDIRPGNTVNTTRMAEVYASALQVMDQWLLDIEAHPTGDVVASKPAGAADQCRATNGSVIAAGPDVWSGAVELIETGEGAWTGSAPTEVDGVAVGACSARFPLHSTSRVVAGAPVTGDVYKCHTKPVSQAIVDGDYGTWAPTTAEVGRLEAIFPNGVCDYSRPSVGHPSLPCTPDLAPFTSVAAAVDQMYLDLSGRSPTSTERAAWTAAIEVCASSIDDVAVGLLPASQLLTDARLTRLYLAFFNRPPDPSGFDYWQRQLAAGWGMIRTALHFARSSEFSNTYGSLSNGAFVDLLYQNVLGRAPDPTGRAFWLTRLDNRTRNRGEVMIHFSEAPENVNRKRDHVQVFRLHRSMLQRFPSAAPYFALADPVIAGTATLADAARAIRQDPRYAGRF